METKEVKVSVHKSSENGYPSLVADKVARRAMLQLVGVNLILGNVVCTALAAPMQEMKEPDVLRYSTPFILLVLAFFFHMLELVLTCDGCSGFEVFQDTEAC